MTSTAVLEIIDLTYSPPPDSETQKVPKTTNYSTDQDPEKNTTRVARKRKNGEARSYPAKSPDGSHEHGHAQSGESAEMQTALDAQESTGGPKGKKKRRSKKNKDKENMDSVPPSREDIQHDARHDALPTLDNEQLFFVDTAPAAVPEDLAFDSARDAKVAPSSSQTSGTPPPDKIPLFLPAHVSVLDAGEDLLVRTIQPEESDSGSDSYIEYLDYDDRLAPDMVRYFEAAAEAQKRFVCKRCGAESEHKTKECPVQICLTCGVRDEHSTRSCPIGKTCFTCGMKGHINKNCPNRYSRGRVNNYDDCDRCGSDKHNTNECPTIWRLYDYVTDREREAILQLRDSKQPLALGQGGEGYIANDEWCYNCGSNGHLGDDCQELPRPHDVPDAPSAFGLWNTLSGPFYDAAAPPVRARAPRNWENGETFGDGWGANAPINVGKRARNKDRARMERHALELEVQEQDDEGDWFANARNVRNRGVRGAAGSVPRPRSPDAGGQHGFRKKDAKIRIMSAWKSDDPPPSHIDRKPSLLERVSNDDDRDHHSYSRDYRHDHHSRDRENKYRDRDRDRDRGRERNGWERSRERDNDRNWDRGRGQDRGQDYGDGLSVRGSASRNDSSRHTGSELREGRRREDSRTRSSRDRDRERDSRTNRDRGQRGPQYRGGYTR